MADVPEIKDQYKRWGFPLKGRRAPNAARHRGLKFLQHRREHAGPATVGQGTESFGFSSLMIPELDYYCLITQFPDLNSKDAEIQKLAWQKFARDPASEIYRSDRSIGKKRRTGS